MCFDKIGKMRKKNVCDSLVKFSPMFGLLRKEQKQVCSVLSDSGREMLWICD